MKKEYRVLVIGSGSMGKRFANIIASRGHQVTFYLHKPTQSVPVDFLTTSSLDNLARYDACFICSPTSTHTYYLEKCLSAGLHIFIEKPIASSLKGLKKIISLKHNNQVLMVGFNLRTLPIIEKMVSLMPQLGSVLYAQFSIGQYLPTWRPEKSYTHFYSAHYDQGGGVSLDLVHEIDLALTLFPNLVLKKAEGQKLSTLAIDVEDYAEFRFENPRVTIKLDYLSHVKTRRYHIVGERGSLVCDVIEKKLEMVLVDGSTTTITDETLFDRDKSFELELDVFLNAISKKAELESSARFLGIDALSYALKARKHYV